MNEVSICPPLVSTPATLLLISSSLACRILSLSQPAHPRLLISGPKHAKEFTWPPGVLWRAPQCLYPGGRLSRVMMPPGFCLGCRVMLTAGSALALGELLATGPSPFPSTGAPGHSKQPARHFIKSGMWPHSWVRLYIEPVLSLPCPRDLQEKQFSHGDTALGV